MQSIFKKAKPTSKLYLSKKKSRFLGIFLYFFITLWDFCRLGMNIKTGAKAAHLGKEINLYRKISISFF